MLAQAKHSQTQIKSHHPLTKITTNPPNLGEKKKGFPLQVMKKLRGAMKGKDTYPPLLVLFTGYNNYFSFNKCELIIIICLTVINGLHSPNFVFPLKIE